MGNIKKYNGKNWDVVATNNSRDIVIDGLTTNENPISLNDVLQKHNNDIEKLKRNVAWLALHGGGGSGGSGGGSSYEATCVISVNGSESSENELLIGKDDKIDILFSKFSSNAKNSWIVEIRLGSILVKTLYVSSSNPAITLKYEDLVSKMTSLTSSISISANYNDDNKGVYGSVSYVNNLMLNTCELITEESVNVEHTEIMPTSITYGYKVPKNGEYKLIIKTFFNGEEFAKYEENITISVVEGTLSYVIGNIFGTKFEGAFGLFNFETTLVNVEKTDLVGVVKHDITVISDTIVISAPKMSENAEKPINTSIDAQLYFEYTAIVSGVKLFDSQYYTVYNGQKIQIAETKNNTFGDKIKDYIVLDKNTWGKITEDEPLCVELKIVTSSGKEASKEFYFNIQKNTNTYLQFRELTQQKIIGTFDATLSNENGFDFAIKNTNYYTSVSGNTLQSYIRIQNGNSIAKLSHDDETQQPYLRISNGAYALLDTEWVLNYADGKVEKPTTSSLFATTVSNSINNTHSHQCDFTISLCFKADYHADDDRTIFAFANLDAQNEYVDGIVVNVHNIYINKSNVLPLIDNQVNNVVITCEYVTSTNKHNIRVYLNGVLSYAIDGVENLFNTSKNILPQMTLGALYGLKTDENGNVHNIALNLCDFNLYHLQFFKKSINEFDVLIDYANNLGRSNYKDALPNYELLQNEIKTNFCALDEKGNISQSVIYDISDDKYNFSNFFTNNEFNHTFISQNIENIGIPLMYIDVSDSWTYGYFIKDHKNSADDALKLNGRTIQYFDPTQANSTFIKINNCTIEPQGTSTKSDVIKNLNIIVPDSTIFIPIPEWLPEKVYTLKADIVDSSHSNNAAIGKFINRVLGDFLPKDSNAENNVKTTTFFTQQCSEDTQKRLKLKHTVEGFPILLFIRFKAEEGQQNEDPMALGIYSFNLGRDSVRNLGFEKLEEVKDSNSQLVSINSYPYLLENAQIKVNNTNTGHWIEIGATNSVDGFNRVVNSLPNNLNASEGDFWQVNDKMIDRIYEVRYPGGYPSTVTSFKDFVNYIVELPIEGCYSSDGRNNINRIAINTSIKQYDIDTNGNIIDTNSVVVMKTDPNSVGSPNNYFNTESAYKYFVVALLFGLVDNFGKNLTFRNWYNPSTKNYGPFYFGFYDMDTAIGGDNQGKMDTVYPLIWTKYLYNDLSSLEDEIYTITSKTDYYEVKINNKSYTGKTYMEVYNAVHIALNKTHYVKNLFDCNYDNEPNKLHLNTKKEFGYIRETYNEKLGEMCTVVSANQSKLWMSLDTEFMRKVLGREDFNISLYSDYWCALRGELEKIVNEHNAKTNVTKYEDFASFFMNEYHKSQIGKCGALLLNYDYRVKYLLNARIGERKTDEVTLNKMHGRKFEYCLNWLKEHIIATDSYFYWREGQGIQTTFKNDFSKQAPNNTYMTPVSFPIKTNTTLIMYVAVGDAAKSYYFMTKNKTVNVGVGNNNSNSPVKWNLSHIPYIIEFGDENTKLKEMNIDTFGIPSVADNEEAVGYSSLTNLDLSNSTELSSNFGLTPFTTRPISELRYIDFSNAKCRIEGNNFELSLQNNQGFTHFKKLISLKLDNSSCISNVTLPSVPLTELSLLNSRIQKLNLINQTYLSSVDLSGCEKIQSIVIQNCSMFGDLIINEMKNLETITFVNCPQAKQVKITNCPLLKKVIIESCDGLNTITINNCKVLNNELSITSCGNLKSINISNNPNLSKIALNLESSHLSNIIKFEAYDTKLKQITNTQNKLYDPLNPTEIISWKGEEGHLDFRFCSTELEINLSGNTEVQFIHLRNDISNPITLKNSFYLCKNLERIYGHFKLINYYNSAENLRGIFRNCYKFSIHGQIDENSTWKGKTILSTAAGEKERIKTCWEIIDNQQNKNYNPATKNVNRTNREIFEKCFENGENVTNITFAEPSSNIQASSVCYAFAGTKITQFDIYYFITMVAVSPELENSDYAYDWSYTFYCNENQSEGYVPNEFLMWESKNELNRYTFYKFDRMISSFYFIYSSINRVNPTYFYAPQTINGVFQENGLLSPLKKLKGFSMFSHRKIVTTRELFFIDNEDSINNKNRNITSITEQNFGNIFYSEKISFNDEEYDITDYSVYSGFNANYEVFLSQDVEIFSEICGNLTNFFQPLSNLDTIYSTMTLPFINYNTINLPNTLQRCASALYSTYGYGEINFNTIFPSDSIIKDISQSFIVNKAFIANDVKRKVKFKLSNDTFKNTKQLEYYGMSERYPTNTDGCRTCYGDGVDIYFEEMPYEIVSKLKNLKICNSLFENAKYSGSTIWDENNMLELPREMFMNNINLTYVDRLFYGIQIPYKLSSEGFMNCTKLKSIKYGFANKVLSIDYGPQGSIPYKLLYHGHNTSSKEIRGINSDTKPGETKYPIISEDTVIEGETIGIQKVIINNVIYSATTKNMLLGVLNTTSDLNVYKIELDSSNNQFILNLKIPQGYNTIKWTYNSYNKCIENVSYLFSQCVGLTYYNNDNYEDGKENNETYNPYNWHIVNNTWVKNENYEETKKEFDISWSYDGRELDNIDIDTLCYDKDHKTIETEYFQLTNSEQIQNFCCPPDLFRYCLNNRSLLNIEGVFNYCGSDYGTNAGGKFGDADFPKPNIGLCGKIPSILLKPISNVNSIKNLFRFCRHLSSYKVDDAGNEVRYLIPKDFFKYAPKITILYQTFQGMDFGYGTEFNVFKNLTERLDIRKMFANSTFGSDQGENIKTINGIFVNNKFSQIAGVFSFSNLTEISQNNVVTSFSIPQLGHMYGKYNSTKILNLFDKNLPELSKITHVYYGWTSSKAEDAKISTDGRYYNY